jgi:gliotoxin/aspirochlorine biosynthesis gamma-glutamylcyclotransferase
MASAPKTAWYFAYGSNMSSDTFTGSRGIIPLKSARVYIPGWILSMEIPGMPYSEPSFGSIVPRKYTDLERGKEPDVIGVAYLITSSQYRQVVASEGGGIAYRDICVCAEPVDEDDRRKIGDRISVHTLTSAMVRHPCPHPSLRYMVSASCRSCMSSMTIADQVSRVF